MAVHQASPVIDILTLKEGVVLLSDTGFPVSKEQLRDIMKGRPRERHGATDYYKLQDVWEGHRDYVLKVKKAKGQTRLS